MAAVESGALVVARNARKPVWVASQCACGRALAQGFLPITRAWPPPAPLPVQDFDAEEQEQIEEEHESGERAFCFLK